MSTTTALPPRLWYLLRDPWDIPETHPILHGTYRLVLGTKNGLVGMGLPPPFISTFAIKHLSFDQEPWLSSIISLDHLVLSLSAPVCLPGVPHFLWASGLLPTLVNVVKLENPLNATVVSEYIKEHILERNLVNITNVVKPLHVLIIFKCIKVFIVDINYVNLNMLGPKQWHY